VKNKFISAIGFCMVLGLMGCGSIWTDATSPTPSQPPNPQITIGRWFSSTSQSSVITWSGSFLTSGTASAYQYALGSTRGGNDIKDWTSVGLQLYAQASGLSLADGSVYYASVRAVDSQGVAHSTFSSTACTVRATGQSVFHPITNYSTGADNNPHFISFMDLNGDGHLDLVGGYTSVNAYLNNGDGTFGSDTVLATGLISAQESAVADFNHDSISDLVLLNYNAGPPTYFTEFLGNGASSFQASPTNYSGGTNDTSITAVDLNHDGWADVATNDFGGNAVKVFLNNKDGTFAGSTTYASGNSPKKLYAIDLNGDGYPDLVTSDSTDNTISILINNGDGTFKPRTTQSTGTDPYGIAGADFNHDGYMDLAVTNYTAHTVSIFLGNNDGTFQAKPAVTVGNSPYSVYTADINGDGQADLIVLNAADNTVGILLGNIDGSFQTMVTYATGTGPYRAAIGDLNGDGIPDIGVTNHGTNSLGILLSE
jgi:hypothetical protein